MKNSKWLSARDTDRLAARLQTTSSENIARICTEFVNGGTHQGKLVYVSRLRAQLRELGCDLDDVRADTDVDLGDA